jgi:hypothetical protein
MDRGPDEAAPVPGSFRPLRARCHSETLMQQFRGPPSGSSASAHPGAARFPVRLNDLTYSLDA